MNTSTFSQTELAALSADLAPRMLDAAGLRHRETLGNPEALAALQRSLATAIVVAMAQVTALEGEEGNRLDGLLIQFLDHPDAGRELALLLRGAPLDADDLRYALEEAVGTSTPAVAEGLLQGLRAFQAAFFTAVEAEPLLTPVIPARQALERADPQHELMENVRQISALLRAAQLTGINAGEIVAENVVNGVLVIHQWSGAAHGQGEKDAPALREAYLQRLFHAAGRLSLTAVDPHAASDAETHLSLNAVYTALLTREVEGQDRPGAGDQLPREQRRLSALAQLDRHAHLVLLGEPGSGKSTFVNFVTLCLAGEALGHAEANLEYLTAPLPDEEGNDQPERQSWSHGALLPVRVILRDFAARGLPATGEVATAEHLWGFVVAELEAAALGDYAPLLHRELLERGGLLLLDGLDEVPEADRRREQIKAVVEDFRRTFGRCRILVTSRTYAYQHQAWRLRDFAETVLDSFSAGQVRRFVDRWYAHVGNLRGLKPGDAQGRAKLLKRAIFAGDRLRGLAERPLLLTLIASLHAWRGGSLPERREQLYADAVTLLLDCWENGRVVRDGTGKTLLIQPSLAELLQVGQERVRHLLEELAYQAHAGQVELTGTADIPETLLLNHLIRLSENPDIRPARLLEFLRDRAGLLVARGVGVYTLPHRTFQEYLAACHLTNHGFPSQVAELARADPNCWREVVLLAGAKAMRGSTYAAWALVDALCYREPEWTDSGIEDEWGARLAGEMLLESVDLERTGPQDRAKTERVRRWQVHLMRSPSLPALERVGAGRLLGNLGDARPEAATVVGMAFCYVPGGGFTMGSAEDDLEAWDDEKPPRRREVPYGYWLGRYPVTVAQFRAFEAAGGYEEGRYWAEAERAGIWRDGMVKGRFDRTARRGPVDFGEPYSLPNHPAVGMTWYEALAFARWLGAWLRERGRLVQGWQVILPSEAEWELAARGAETIPVRPVVATFAEDFSDSTGVALESNPHTGRRFPWGNDVSAERANYRETGIGATSAVGCFPGGASTYGVEELSGNVWEWTRSVWGTYSSPAERRGPRTREDLERTFEDRVLRGGAFSDMGRTVRCAARNWGSPDLRHLDVGLRVAVSPSTSEL